jgi:hypothetical protein
VTFGFVGHATSLWIESAAFEADVDNPDQTVGHLTEGLAMRLALCPDAVVTHDLPS